LHILDENNILPFQKNKIKVCDHDMCCDITTFGVAEIFVQLYIPS
jgi:hypothetical protein